MELLRAVLLHALERDPHGCVLVILIDEHGLLAQLVILHDLARGVLGAVDGGVRIDKDAEVLASGRRSGGSGKSYGAVV